jgi:heme iron utilization protein
VSDPPRRSAAEEARALVASATAGTLATLSADGGPWASLVTYGTLPDGSPVLLLSALAEHGRNLQRDPRASLLVTQPGDRDGDPLDLGRVTLAGRAVRPQGALAAAARDAHVAAVPGAREYAEFGDFTLWVLQVERVRWVGGFGRMASCDGPAYAAVELAPRARGYGDRT